MLLLGEYALLRCASAARLKIAQVSYDSLISSTGRASIGKVNVHQVIGNKTIKMDLAVT